MRILVIGGTRFIGKAVVRRLVAHGHEVAVCNRGRTKSRLPDGVQRIIANRDNLADSRGALHRFAPDIVVHNIALHKKHAAGAVEVFRGMASRLVFVSSMDVYRAFGRLSGLEPGPLEPMPSDEDAPLRERSYPYRAQAADTSDPRWDYDKIPAEKVVLSDPDLPGTVLRLPMVLGPDDYQHRLFPMVRPMLDRRREIVLQEDYAHWRSTYAYVENVGEAIALACTNEQAAGRIYDVADEALSTLELGWLISCVLEWDGEFVLLPRDKLPDALVVPMNVEQDVVSRAERIRKELGYEPLVPLRDGVRDAVGWEMDNPLDPIDASRLAYEAQDEVLRKLGPR
jgi:nucleoside-diphosphate-sugar epimerase